MSAQFSIPDAEKIIAGINFSKYVRHVVKEAGTNLDRLSQTMNKERGYLFHQLKRTHTSLPLLYALTMHLKVNMFEPILNSLPEHLRGTRREAALQAEIDRLTSELAAVTKERDIYKEVAVRR